MTSDRVEDRRRPVVPVLDVRELSKRYPGTLALDRVSLHVAPNEILGLAGHNGAGKSTLTRMLTGAGRPDSGDMLLDGQSIRFRSPDDAITHGVAQVPQPLMIIPNLTGRENLLLGMHTRLFRPGRENGEQLWFGGSKSAVAAVELMAEHLHLTKILNVKVGRLRPVTQRLIMIGRALLRNPRLIILDEPTANLATPEVELLFSIIRPLARDRASVIYVTHRLDEMLDLCDRVIVMRQGRVIAEKDARILDKKELSGLITGADLSSKIKTLVADVDIHGQVHAGGPSADRSKTPHAGEEVLCCEDLCALPRTRGVDLRLHRGEVLGIAGRDGSGRTSLLRTLWGDRQVTSGRIVVRGVPTRLASPRDAIKAGFAYLPEERAANAVFPLASVAANATLPWLSRFAGPGGLMRAREEISSVSTLLKRLDVRPLKGAAYARIGAFSGGNQQKVVIARWLLGGADIFLFDEPTQGIDVGAREQVYEVIRELASDGAGIIVVSSEAEELARLCSTVHLMRDGAVVQTLAGDDVTESAISLAIVAGEIEIPAAEPWVGAGRARVSGRSPPDAAI
ncbi:ribose transport system ATP-binding protein [Roseiarcus fermentans]|uniref:Ribose transport system ATP-binding protein n=1 Tax=Roseiarcus fermentans TaxID=1473586 RepID=A0A366FLW2_9HYPH|nr:sugar ABC transporter ATP-binding protein [Roseiarcus fermentans]RBP15587.1 ribose transport system ATP-binding protein [Roseiarcus fermentans]